MRFESVPPNFLDMVHLSCTQKARLDLGLLPEDSFLELSKKLCRLRVARRHQLRGIHSASASFTVHPLQFIPLAASTVALQENA